MSMTKRNFKIWIIDEDEGARSFYRSTLTKYYDVLSLRSLNDLEGSFNSKPSPGLIISEAIFSENTILDVHLKGLWRKLRQTELWIISEIEDMDTIRQVFKQGAQDFLAKPIRSCELLIRVEQLVARMDSEIESIFSFKIEGFEIEGLTSKQKQILSVFMSSPDWIVGREEVEMRVWSRCFIHSKTFNVHIHNLRKKLFSYGYEISFFQSGLWRLAKLSERKNIINSLS